MSGQLRVLFTCRRRGHIYAQVIETSEGPLAVIDNSAYTDVGPRPGTVRVKRSGVEQRLPIGHPTEHWSTDVVCACGSRRFLTCCVCEVQLREWAIHNRPKVRRIVLERTI
jgi:hypothetical protein